MTDKSGKDTAYEEYAAFLSGVSQYDRERQSRWSRGGIAQLAVLVNGLILTVVAYLTLNVFIQDALKDNQNRIADDARSVVSQGIDEMSKSVRTAAVVLSMSGGMTKEQARARILSVVDFDYFDRFFWVHKVPGSEDEWTSETYLAADKPEKLPPLLLEGSEKELKDEIRLRKSIKSGEATVISNLDFDYIIEDAAPLIKAMPFIIVKPIVPDAPDMGMIVGVSRITNIITPQWLEQHESINTLVLRDQLSGQSILYFDRDRKAENYDRPTFQRQDMKFLNAQWQSVVDVGKDNKFVFLANTPLLVLFIGLLLTMVGTLYIRNNQRQSFRLRTMNKALAQKNYDLNTEIVERERLNQSLRKAEREYRAIIDAVSDIIFELSADGEILFLNATWQKISGIPAGEARHTSLFDYVHPHDQAEQIDSFRQLVNGDKHAYKVYTRMRVADGTFRAIELSMSMMRRDENKSIRVVGAITDIEERRRAEKALAEAERKYRTIVENAAGGIYQVTPEGQFLSANRAMAKILGYESAEKMLGDSKNIHMKIYENPQERSRFIRELEQKGSIRGYETRVITRDGSVIWVSESARAVRDDEDNILYYEGSMEDITKRKEVELKLREAKLESDLASRAKSEFLANMSHELRTPLNAIIGFSEIIKNEVLGPINNKQYWEYSADIYESGKSLLRIINEILDVSHIEAGNRQLNEGVVDLNRVAKSCIDFMDPKIKQNDITVTNLLDRSTPDVIGEELALKQIFLNLLSNAVKYTPQGGRVTLSHELDNEGIRISVTDTGVGLDENEIEKALSPFGQVETSLNRNNSGVGLGLTLVDSLVKLHGGRLELFSQKGVGTTATIFLPMKRVTRDTRKLESDNATPEAGLAREDGVPGEAGRGKPH